MDVLRSSVAARKFQLQDFVLMPDHVRLLMWKASPFVCLFGKRNRASRARSGKGGETTAEEDCWCQAGNARAGKRESKSKGRPEICMDSAGDIPNGLLAGRHRVFRR